MRTIFVSEERCALPSGAVEWQVVHDATWGERIDAELALEDDPLDDGAELRVTEFVELTPRVRLGMWLAEDAHRGFRYTLIDGVTLHLFYDEEITERGNGPTLDAAIEDAMGKLPKEAT